MTTRQATLTLTRLRAMSFRTDDGQNYLVQIRGTTSNGQVIDAAGEALPRGAATGDNASSWVLLIDFLRTLENRVIDVSDAAAARTAITDIMIEFAGLASTCSVSVAAEERAQRQAIPKGARPRVPAKRLVKRGIRTALTKLVFWRIPAPFQGTLRGVEAALVDLLSQALATTPVEILGRRCASLADNMPLADRSAAAYDALFSRVLLRVNDFASFPSPPSPTHAGQPATVYDEVPYLKPLRSNGTKGHLLEREALALGLNTIRFSKGAFVATDGVQPPLIFKWSRSPRSSAVSLALCTHKEATRLLLRRAGVPVPKGRTFSYGDFTAAKAFAERIGYPVVVKPAMGVRGIGVVANIGSEPELDEAFNQLVKSRLGKADFIVEQHITGRDYRIVVVGDEVIAAILREPASVEGDGEHTVAELMVNRNAFRHLNPHLWGRPVKYESAARYQLKRANLSLHSLPAPGQKVVLSNTCSLSQGGDSIDVLDELHPSIKEACLAAVKAVPGLWFCGVDFLIEDHRKPLLEQQAGICELNAHAAIGNCEYPLYGTPRAVARTVMRQTAEHYGLKVNDQPADQLALRLIIRGRIRGTGYRLWVQRHATSFGLAGWIRGIDAQTAEAVLVGGAVPASALAAAAVLGPGKAAPTSVTTEHIERPDVDGFRILEDMPMERRHAR
jgi:D-alanine-D-alanine ligase-like ATP-grasp enzyme/acylphosphatase